MRAIPPRAEHTPMMASSRALLALLEVALDVSGSPPPLELMGFGTELTLNDASTCMAI